MRLRPFWGKKRNAGVSASGPRAPVDLFSDGKGTVVVMHRSEPRSSTLKVLAPIHQLRLWSVSLMGPAAPSHCATLVCRTFCIRPVGRRQKNFV